LRYGGGVATASDRYEIAAAYGGRYPYIARLTAAQEEVEVKDAFGTALGGGPFGAVLEFNFSLRSNVAAQCKGNIALRAAHMD
jgi:hypothetical protein